MADVEAGKRFPFINLEKSIGRAQELFTADPRGNEMSIAGAFAVWGYSAKSSGGFQTIAALRAYGILSGEEGKVRLSKAAFDYFRDEREEERAKALQGFSRNPPLLAALWNQWGDQPPADTLARTHLKLERGLNEQSARVLLGIYKDNISYANLKGNDTILDADEDKGEAAETGAATGAIKKPPPPPPPFQRGHPPVGKGLAVMEGERELTTGLLSKDANFRLIVSGRVGVKEIETLIKKLEIDKGILADESDPVPNYETGVGEERY